MSADDRSNTMNEADKFLVHMGADPENGVVQAFRNEATYSNQKLEETLDEIIAFIKKTQKIFMAQKEQLYNNEFEKLNLGKDL